MNMPTIVVTLEVSRVSGWLNSDADCAEWKGGHIGSGRNAGWIRTGAERTLNMRYMLVTLDVSKLSGWLNADAPCRVERRAYYVWGEMQVGRLKGVVRRQRKRSAGEVPRLKIGVRARAECTRNMVSMVLTLDASKLSS